MISYYTFEFTLIHCAYEYLQQICRVCSSEKVDKWARYAEFLIASMPYPGKELVQWHRVELKELLYVCMLMYISPDFTEDFNWSQVVSSSRSTETVVMILSSCSSTGARYHIAGNFWGWKLSQLLTFCGYSKVFSVKFVGVVSFGGTSKQSRKVFFFFLCEILISTNLWKLSPANVSHYTVFQCVLFTTKWEVSLFPPQGLLTATAAGGNDNERDI